MAHTTSAIEDLAKLSDSDRQRWAYLALTGKLENAVRDHLAFTIQTKGANLLVGRDLAVNRGLGGDENGAHQRQRYDLVVYQRGRLNEVAEAKQFFTFDYQGNQDYVNRKVATQLAGDVGRLTDLAREGVTPVVHMLLLVCHVSGGRVPANFDRVAKYNLHLPSRLTAEDSRLLIPAALAAHCESWEIRQVDNIELGAQLELSVSLTPFIASYTSNNAGAGT